MSTSKMNEPEKGNKSDEDSESLEEEEVDPRIQVWDRNQSEDSQRQKGLKRIKTKAEGIPTTGSTITVVFYMLNFLTYSYLTLTETRTKVKLHELLNLFCKTRWYRASMD